MTEQELRALVRDAIARHRRESGTVSAPFLAAAPFPLNPLPPSHMASSHAMFVLATGADQDGPCLIEPTVDCNHCGYCKSLGH